MPTDKFAHQFFKLPLLKNQCFFPLKEMQGLILEFMINCSFRTALTLADLKLESRKLNLQPTTNA